MAKKAKTASIRVRLKLPDVETFKKKYSPNVSKAGIFIKTNKLYPIGTTIKFDILLSDNKPVVRGIGEISWVRDVKEGASFSGIGVKYKKLNASSKKIIFEILDIKSKKKNEVRPSLYSIPPPAINNKEAAENEIKPELEPEPDLPENQRETNESIKKQESLESDEKAIGDIATDVSPSARKKRRSRKRGSKKTKSRTSTEVKFDEFMEGLSKTKSKRKRRRGRRHKDTDISDSSSTAEVSPVETPIEEKKIKDTLELDEKNLENATYEPDTSDATPIKDDSLETPLPGDDEIELDDDDLDLDEDSEETALPDDDEIELDDDEIELDDDSEETALLDDDEILLDDDEIELDDDEIELDDDNESVPLKDALLDDEEIDTALDDIFEDEPSEKQKAKTETDDASQEENKAETENFDSLDSPSSAPRQLDDNESKKKKGFFGKLFGK